MAKKPKKHGKQLIIDYDKTRNFDSLLLFIITIFYKDL